MFKFSTYITTPTLSKSLGFFSRGAGVSSFFLPSPVIQTKLAHKPNDEYDQEAGVTDDKIMGIKKSRLPLNPPSITTVQRKCAHCEEEEKVQRKEINAEETGAENGLTNYVNNPGNSGHPLPNEVRNYYEPRFGYDFSKVKLHTDSVAAKSAQSVNALAFTSGNNIVFNHGQYSPGTNTGKKLLAHELTHVIQQSGQTGNATKNTIQRKPEKMEAIKERLTRSFSDWAVTDQDVKDVLIILRDMESKSQVNFKDTIAKMEEGGLVDELFDEISDDDKEDFAILLRKIQLNRVRELSSGKKIVDSCLPENKKEITETLADVKAWARKCFVAVNGYVFDLELTGTPDPATATALENHFFHQAKNKKLEDYQKIKFANEIADNFRKVEVQANPFTHECAQPYDPLCGALALAYVKHSDKTVNYCSPFFKKDKADRIPTVFHELFHVFAFVGDPGYGHERVYKYLLPAEAINNADSYENFALEILKPKGQNVPRAPADEYSDCSKEHEQILKHRLAFAERMVTNSLNVIGAPDNVANQKGGETEIFFQTIVRSELTKIIERFKELDTALESSVGIECEKECDKGIKAYNRHPGFVVHICPEYFGLGEDAQVDLMLLYMADRKVGGKIKNAPGTAAFGKQTKEDAYDNLWTFVAYARAITGKNANWQYLGAEFRYEREIQSSFEQLSEHLLPEITEEQNIRSKVRWNYVHELRKTMRTDLGSAKIESSSAAEGKRKNYIGMLNDTMKLANLVSDGFMKFSGESFLKWMFADKADEIIIKNFIERLDKKVAENLMMELDTQFKLIQAGGKADISKTETVIKDLTKKYIDNLKLLDGYLPFIHEVMAMDEPVEKYKDKLKSKLPASKQSHLDFYYTVNMSVSFDIERGAMYKAIVENIISGKPYDPKARPGDIASSIKKFKDEIEAEYKNLKASK